MTAKTTRRLALNSFCLLLSGIALGWMVGLAVSPVIQTILTSLIAVVVSLSTALAGLRLTDSVEAKDSSTDSVAGETGVRKLRKTFPPLLDPLPVASMVIGLALGASIGVYARTNDWLGARTNSLITEWKATGLSEKDITTRVFNSLYPPPEPSAGVKETVGASAHDEKESSKGETNAATATTPGEARNPVTGPRGAGLRTGTDTTKRVSSTEDSEDRFNRGVLFDVSMKECDRLKNAEGDELRREMASSSSDGLVSLAKTCKTDECLRAGVTKACAKYR